MELQAMSLRIETRANTEDEFEEKVYSVGKEMRINNWTPGYADRIDVGTLPWAEGSYCYF